MYSCFVSLLALSLPVLTSLNVLMPAGSSAGGEATEEEEEVAEEGGATQKVHACHALLGSLVSFLLLAVQYLVFLIVLVN